MPDREPTPMELHRRMEAFDRRQTAQDELAKERHTENRESMREIRDAMRDQVDATNGLSEKVTTQNGRVTGLEFGHRELRRDVQVMQQTATEAATMGAVEAIHQTAPSRKQANLETAKWTGIMTGTLTGAGLLVKLILENWHTVIK